MTVIITQAARRERVRRALRRPDLERRGVWTICPQGCLIFARSQWTIGEDHCWTCGADFIEVVRK